MKPIWQIDAADVIGLQGQPVEFARFVNDLLVQQVTAARVRMSALEVSLKIHAPDGGADAAVLEAIPRELDPEGWFEAPTCWQYKSSPSDNIGQRKTKKLRSEIQKGEVRQRIAKGFAYRLCVADDLSAKRKSEWESCLWEEARKITADAWPPRVLTASNLATWANRFPGMLLQFRPALGPLTSPRALRTWGEEISNLTPHFVPVPTGKADVDAIQIHTDLARSCPRVLLTIQGEAGVGKTRCVYEALAAQEVNQALVVYTTNEAEAERIADVFANDPRLRGILVADECGVHGRVALERRLQPCRDRVRLLAIDNSFQDTGTGTGEIRLQRLTQREVEEIIEANQPGLPGGRRRAFVALSGGFVRLAVDLCARADLIPEDGDLGAALDFFRDHYLTWRIDEDQRRIVEAVALLPKVGYKGDIRHQLDNLCQATGLSPERVVEVATRLKQSPGFIALGERYLYVTPRLIAQAAFQLGWQRWVASDVERFLVERLPGDLLEPFANQLKDCGTAAMRAQFADFFQDWAGRLTGADLADAKTVRRLARLVEVEPRLFLPSLLQIVESLPREELRQFHAAAPVEESDAEQLRRGGDGQAARFELVRLATKLLCLTEHFVKAERLLWRLALAETERYAQNATGVWRQIYQIEGSGTPLPFSVRLQLLESRFSSAEPAHRALCLAGLREALNPEAPAGGPVGPPVVAGRIPPDDWQPANAREEAECLELAVALARRLAGTGDPTLRDGVSEIIIEHLPGLLLMGRLDDVIAILGLDPLTDARLSQVLSQVDGFLARGVRVVPEESVAAVRAWRDRLIPTSLHGRLVAHVGLEPWGLGDRGEGQLEAQLTELARHLLANPAALDHELAWLLSAEARQSTWFGGILGRLDEGAYCLDRLVRAAASSRYPGLARGYLQGLARHHPKYLERLNSLLDQLQETSPRAVYEMLPDGVEALRPLPRILALVDSGRLPIEVLRGFGRGLLGLRLSREEVWSLVERLTAAAQRGNDAAGRAALYVLCRSLRPPQPGAPAVVPSDPGECQRVADLLALSLAAARQDPADWMELVQAWAKVDPTSAIALSVRALAELGSGGRDLVDPLVIRLASEYPAEVMNCFGTALLDRATHWQLERRPARALVLALPPEVVFAWLEEHGSIGAAALARHLPLPSLDAQGTPVVPHITRVVLERYREDDEVFRGFCTGSRSGGIRTGGFADGSGTTPYDCEAARARRFLDHPSRRIREWARNELACATRDASWWRAREEEFAIP